MYTGVSYHSNQNCYYLSDELGNIEVFSSFKEKTLDVIAVKPANPKQAALVIKSHKDPMLSYIKLFSREAGEFLAVSPFDGRILMLQVMI